MLHYYSRIAAISGLQASLDSAAAQAGQRARVVSVLDASRGSPKSMHWDDLNLKKRFSLANAANHCITMNDIALQVGSDSDEPEHLLSRHPEPRKAAQ